MKVRPDLPRQVPCPIAFVGEAPGEEEVIAGRPLVGPSGQVFNALLRTAKIDRAECLVTNVFSEKAEGNDCGPWLKRPDIYLPAVARLQAEIAAAQPAVVVPLGGTALFALLGSTDITGYRGNVVAGGRDFPGLKLLPSFHPAYILRAYKHYAIAAGDFMKAKREAERGPVIVHPRRQLLLSPSMEELQALTPKLLSCPLLSVDIETGYGQITHLGMAWSQEEAVCVPFFPEDTLDGNYWPTARAEAEAWGWAKSILESPVPKLGQNFGSYDAMWLLVRKGIRVRNLLHDTRLLHHALYPELEKSLAFMGAAYGSQGPWKLLGRRAGLDVGKQDD